MNSSYSSNRPSALGLCCWCICSCRVVGEGGGVARRQSDRPHTLPGTHHAHWPSGRPGYTRCSAAGLNTCVQYKCCIHISLVCLSDCQMFAYLSVFECFCLSVCKMSLLVCLVSTSVCFFCLCFKCLSIFVCIFDCRLSVYFACLEMPAYLSVWKCESVRYLPSFQLCLSGYYVCLSDVCLSVYLCLSVVLPVCQISANVSVIIDCLLSSCLCMTISNYPSVCLSNYLPLPLHPTCYPDGRVPVYLLPWWPGPCSSWWPRGPGCYWSSRRPRVQSAAPDHRWSRPGSSPPQILTTRTSLLCLLIFTEYISAI